MQKIINIVKDYLTKENNNALLITGEWGVGKTYFFNNILSKEIEKTSTKENESVKYTPIRISLFGVTSINDIEKRIILEIYPLLKNKGLKIGKGLLNVILSSPIIKELTQQIPENILNLSDDYKSDIINSKTSSLVICFDDLERKSHIFPISSLIGYINNFTENNNLKVIIIGNTNNMEENFVEIKEKLIGREIEYKINIEEVFDTLIQSEFQSFSGYIEFLQKEKNFICSFFHNYKNIRTLKFILTRYHDIYSQIEKIASSIDYIHSNKDTVLKETLLFTIAISIEYKGGSVTRNNKEEIDNIIRFSRKDIERFLNKETSHDQKNDEEETILKKIKSNYYYQNNVIYYFYEPIFDYIVGLNILDENLLEKDIKKKYKISEDNTIPECYIIYNQIKFNEVFSMSNDNYKQLLTNMLSYVDSGEYRLEHYNRIYNLVLSFNNPLKIKEDKLKNRIIKGMKKNKDKFVYNPELLNKLLYESDVDKNEKEIIDLCLTINNEKEQEKHKQDSTNLINILKNDFDHFEHQVESKYNNIPIFKYIKSKEIFNFYNSEIHLRIRLFESFNLRNRSCRKDILLMEKHFYEQLQQSIEKKEKQLKSGPEWALYNSFNELLQSIIKNP